MLSKFNHKIIASLAILIILSVLIQQHFISINGHAALFHTGLQTITSACAFIIGLIGLTAYHKNGICSPSLLFISVGFIGMAFIDGYHTLITTTWFATHYPEVPKSIARWSWLCTRVYLAVLFLFAIFFLNRENHKHSFIKSIYGLNILLVAVILSFFILLPIPDPESVYEAITKPFILSPVNYPIENQSFIARPYELIPGFLFIFALLSILAKTQKSKSYFEQSLIICLIINIFCQFFYMALSKELFDTLYFMAHILKIASYFVVFFGIFLLIQSHPPQQNKEHLNPS